TGIGKSSYSVIEQGRIDKILSKNPEERRGIFEEAASIAKYRDRKKEYERKIERSRENLLRVRDLLKELEKQHALLKKQAEVAERHFDLQEKLKQEDIHFFLYRMVQIMRKREECTVKIAGQKAQAEKIEKDIAETGVKLESYQSQIKSREEELSQSEKKKIELSEKIHSLSHFQKMLSERREDVEKQVALLAEDREKIEKEKKEIHDRLTELSKDIGTKRERSEQNQTGIKNLNDRIELLGKKIEELGREHETFKRREAEIREERARLLKENSVVIDSLIREIDAAKRKTLERKTGYDSKKKRLREVHDEIGAKLKSLLRSENEDALLEEKRMRLSAEREALRTAYEEMLNGVFALKSLSKEEEKLASELVAEKDPFYELIFSAEGTYARKEKIEAALTALQDEGEKCEERMEHLASERTLCEKSRSEAQREVAAVEIDNAGLLQSLEMLEKIREEKVNQLGALDVRLSQAGGQSDKFQAQIKDLDGQRDAFTRDKEQFESLNRDLLKSMTSFQSNIADTLARLEKSRERKTNLEDALKALADKREAVETEILLLDKDVENLRETAITQYSENLRDHESRLVNTSFDPEAIRKNIQLYKDELRTLGAVNPLAREEFKSVDERLTELRKQREDIETSTADLEKISAEIDESSKELFLETFSRIQKNFHQVFRRLFGGGRGSIELIDAKEPLTSGIEILVQPPGKKFQNINLFSGGEKSLIAVALMFSIFLVKPSPICLLDEVDAALDKENINRLARLLAEFKDKTQFLLISHNEKTVSIIDYLYGVSMQNGVTKTVSLRLSKQEEPETLSADEPSVPAS
ncbi:MAG: AAA family ATPase, partial [Spirochaetia bacterium]|nr:AAA family ATPase [Spirochaetia bacterium]